MDDLEQSVVRTLTDDWGDCSKFPRKFNETACKVGLKWIYGLSGTVTPEIIYAANPEECWYIANSLHWKGDEDAFSLNARVSPVAVAMSIFKELNPEMRDSAHRVYHWLGGLNRQRQAVSMVFNRMQPMLSKTCVNAPQLGALSLYAKLVGGGQSEDRTSRNIENFIAFAFRSGIFLGIFGRKLAILCPTPLYVTTAREGSLHSTEGPAVKWTHGYEIHALNGVVVPDYIVNTSAEDLDPHLLLTEKNAEVRREIVRKVGIERVIKKLGSKIINRWRSYLLIEIVINSDLRPRYLWMRNPSIDAYHLEGVPPFINTCREALAWRDGENSYIRPDVIT